MEDLKQAMKEKHEVRKSVITLIRSAIKNKEINIGRPLTEEEQLAIIRTELKQTKQALNEFEKAGIRPDLVEVEKQKIDVIMRYLPQQMTEEEVRSVVLSLGVNKDSHKGQVIGMVKKVVKDRAGSELIAKVVTDVITNIK